jgi:hypothetical protein
MKGIVHTAMTIIESEHGRQLVNEPTVICSDCGVPLTDNIARVISVCDLCMSRWNALAIIGTPSRDQLERDAARRELGADYIEDDWDDGDEPVLSTTADVQADLVAWQAQRDGGAS